jgi:hypothetical protein
MLEDWKGKGRMEGKGKEGKKGRESPNPSMHRYTG